MNITEKPKIHSFPEEYKNEIFMIWYNEQKPNANNLFTILPPEKFSDAVPTEGTITSWINTIFKPRAKLLDEQVMAELEGRMVKEKIEMMERHADISTKMQDIAIEYFDSIDIQDKLTPSTATRLLIEFIQIERESRGLPQAMSKMINKTDEELVKELEKIIDQSPSRLEKVDD